MTVFMLQVVAMLTMLCDHLADPFLGNNVILRCIGRFAFLIYAFLLAEGFRHIRSDEKKVEQHLGGLVVMALVSELFYDMLEAKPFTVAEASASQNVLITLLIGFLGMMAIQRWKNKPVWMWSAIGLSAMCTYLIRSNYKFAGVLLIYSFLWYLEHMEGKGYGRRLAELVLIMACYLPLYHWARYDFCGWSDFLAHLSGANTWWYLTHLPVAAMLASYTGELGFYSKKFKKVYRWFYPAHLLVLGLIRQLM